MSKKTLVMSCVLLVCVSTLFFFVRVYAGADDASIATLAQASSVTDIANLSSAEQCLTALDSLPRCSHKPLKTVCFFEECMHTVLRLMPRDVGIKKHPLLPIWHAVRELDVSRVMDAAIDDSDMPCEVQESTVLRAALAHATVIRKFSVHYGRKQAGSLLQHSYTNVCDQRLLTAVGKRASCALAELELFQRSALFMRTLSLLADALQHAVPTIAGMTHGQLTKKLWAELVDPAIMMPATILKESSE